MEKNPVFELPDQPSMTAMSGGRDNTAPGNARPKQTLGRRISGRMCAVATAALFATLVVLALVGVIAIIVFKPTTTESKTVTSASSDQVELQEEEMKNLMELVSKQATEHASNISLLKELHGNAIQEIRQQLDDSNQTIQSMQQKLVQLTVADQNINAKIDNTLQLNATDIDQSKLV